MGIDEWRTHLMTVYRDLKKNDPNTLLKDAMKTAKKTYKQTGGKKIPVQKKKRKRKSKGKKKKKRSQKKNRK